MVLNKYHWITKGVSYSMVTLVPFLKGSGCIYTETLEISALEHLVSFGQEVWPCSPGWILGLELVWGIQTWDICSQHLENSESRTMLIATLIWVERQTQVWGIEMEQADLEDWVGGSPGQPLQVLDGDRGLLWGKLILTQDTDPLRHIVTLSRSSFYTRLLDAGPHISYPTLLRNFLCFLPQAERPRKPP